MSEVVNRWQSIRLVEDFRAVLGEPPRRSLEWFAVACLARIRHLLGPDAIELAEVVEGHADGRLSHSAVITAYQAFLQSHYMPRFVPSQGGDGEIDIGEFDSPASEAVAAAAYLVSGDLIQPEDDRFRSTREQFWLADGMAWHCRDAVMEIIPDLPWHREELSPELEPFRQTLFDLPAAQRLQALKSPESEPRLHAVGQALLAASSRREQRRREAWEAEELHQCHLVREVIPPPFVTPFVPSWRTPLVLDLARGIDQRRAFDRMPVLADALREAGCCDDQLLGHCRSPGPHVRGCWAIEMVLGRE